MSLSLFALTHLVRCNLGQRPQVKLRCSLVQPPTHVRAVRCEPLLHSLRAKRLLRLEEGQSRNNPAEHLKKKLEERKSPRRVLWSLASTPGLESGWRQSNTYLRVAI